jgi:IS605 OrfB family transposase
MKRGEGDDPCSDLLDKSNELREQRVNQAAHLILAEALGLELKSPEEVENKKARRNEVDLHGEYKQLRDPKTGNPLPRCSVIVLEDLTRYRTSQDRTRSENSRLMQWAHRAIVKKLTDIAKPFGITLMLVDPAFSSRFHSQTGLPGIRVNSVSRDFEKEMPYAAWLKQKGKNNKPSDLAERVLKLKELFDQHTEYKGQLLFFTEGGKEFLPVDATDAEMQHDYHPMNADENAAINIGLRAVADPDRWDIFPRLRSVESAEASVRIRNRRGYFATLADDDDKKFLRKEDSSLTPKAIETTKLVSENGEAEQHAESSQYPDFFISNLDFSRFPRSESFQPHPNSGHSFNAYRRGLFLKRVQQLCEKRIGQINKLRLKK